MMMPELMIVGPGNQPCSMASDREARGEHLNAVRGRLDRPERRGFQDVRQVVDVALRLFLVRQREVIVSVDEPGKHGHVREIHHLGAGGDRDVGANGAEPAVFDKDDDVLGRGARFRVDELARTDGDYLCGKRCGRMKNGRGKEWKDGPGG
jgi:hypothetical protein